MTRTRLPSALSVGLLATLGACCTGPAPAPSDTPQAVEDGLRTSPGAPTRPAIPEAEAIARMQAQLQRLQRSGLVIWRVEPGAIRLSPPLPKEMCVPPVPTTLAPSLVPPMPKPPRRGTCVRPIVIDPTEHCLLPDPWPPGPHPAPHPCPWPAPIDPSDPPEDPTPTPP